MKKYTIGQLSRKISRELRSNPTDAEKKLWNSLKNRQFMNLKFLRQHPLYYQYNNKRSFFIADFYCCEVKIVIELDGHIHMKHQEYDQIRTEIIEFKNVIVVRFKNEEIMNDLDIVLKKLNVLIMRRKKDFDKEI